jgi:hypothetical protein
MLIEENAKVKRYQTATKKRFGFAEEPHHKWRMYVIFNEFA